MSFADFPEQQRVVALLQRSLKSNRLAHAYLFTGSLLDSLEGVARTLAKTLNCLDPLASANWDSCDQCLNCRRIDGENHPDVQWIRPESKSRIITIDQMRELMQTVHLKPGEARWKVAMIVAADRLNPQAANAFLKTLEEPPPSSILILLSTEPDRVLETILSRCLRLNFAGETVARIPRGADDWMSTFASEAAKGGKGLLARYRLLGVIVAQLERLKAEVEKNLSARSPLERYDDIDSRLREKWEDQLAASVEAEYRKQRSDLLLVLEWWFRDVWIATLKLGSDLVTFGEFRAQTEQVANRVSTEAARENLAIIERMQRLLHTNVQEALALEVGFLKLQL